MFNNNKWISCGYAYALNITEDNSLAKISNWLPKAWLNVTDYTTGEAVGEDENNDFNKILQTFSFVYDKLRLEASLLGHSNNRIYTPHSILKYKVADFKFPYEPALGDTYHRTLSSVGNIVHSQKGTALGYTTFTTALTHWGSKIYIGHNLLLDYNDSSFEESVGRWSASSGTFAQKTYLAESLVAPSTDQVLWDTITPPRLLGFGQLTTTATTAVTLALPSSSLSILNYGTPVKPNTRYLFSGWVTHRDANGATVSAIITWYDMYGTAISSVSAGTTVTTATTWKEFSSLSSSGRNGSVSPSKARFAKVSITVTPASATSSRFAFDLFQFAEASNSLSYQDARRVNVHVHGEKQNYVPNGGFEDGLHFWKPHNGNIIADSTKTAAIVHGTKCVKLTSTANGTAAIVSDWVQVEPSTAYTASAYVLGSASRKAIIRVEFSNKASLEEQTQVLSDANGDYYSNLSNYSDSEETTLSTTSTKQISVSFLSPPVSKDSVTPYAKVSVYFSDNSAADQYWIDGVMLEEGASVSPYFCGFGGVTPASPVTQLYYPFNDCKWEVRNRLNYMHNTGFETNTTDWTSTGTLTRTDSDNSLSSLYGTYFGKVAFTTSTTITGTYYLKQAANGGEDVVVSAYVRRPSATAITYTMNGSTYTLPASGDGWTRISSVYQLAAGDTTGTFTISISNTTATWIHIDGVMVEYGRIPSQYIKNETGTTTIVNPTNSAKNIYASQADIQNGGRSNYLHNYDVKVSRLRASLGNYAMAGTSWAIKPGLPTKEYTDIEGSLIPANSFESSLGDWTASNSTLSRVISTGSIMGDSAISGQAYAKVTTAGSSGNKPYGLVSAKIPIMATGGYYASVAVRPVASNATGDYILILDFFDANNNLVYSKMNTKSVTQLTRWAYIADTYSITDIAGSSYAQLTVMQSPATYASGQSFHIDNVVFRQ